MVELDVSALEKALASLELALAEHAKQPGNALIRDACIKRFEYSYELSHKMLRRYLSLTAATPETIIQYSFAELIRAAGDKDLLDSTWEHWKRYREARNITSHLYDEQKAENVLHEVPAFLRDASYLLQKLKVAT